MARKGVEPKYQQVFAALQRDILSGKYASGQKLPSEAALVQRFKTSRITIGRAVRQLSERGLVERRAGSGTYVRAAAAANDGHLFGLLIPNLGDTEIFEPICAGIAGALHDGGHALLWGNTSAPDADRGEQARQLCRHYIQRRVAGVFFAPLEMLPRAEEVNQRILAALGEQRIATILLDRSVLAYPRRGRHDLVSIDHRLAGHLAAEHLIGHGCRRIAFLARPHSASSVEARIAGYREALHAHGVPVAAELVQRLNPSDAGRVRALLDEVQPDAVVAANDRTAGQLMHSLLHLGRRVPQDMPLVGIDDVGYASLLPVPLTTVRQPCRAIGEAALSAMRERLASPTLPARDILLDCQLVVRQSCRVSAEP